MRQLPLLLTVLCSAAVARGQTLAFDGAGETVTLAAALSDMRQEDRSPAPEGREVAVAEGAQTDPAEIRRLAESVLLGGIETAQGLDHKQRAALRAGLQRDLAVYQAPKYMDDIYASLTAEVEQGVRAGRFTPKTGEELRTKAMGENDALRRRNIAEIEETLAYLQGADSGAAPFMGPVREKRMSAEGAKLAKTHAPAILKDGAAAARKLTVQERQLLRAHAESTLKNLRTMQEAIAKAPPGSPNFWPSLPAEISGQQRILDALREADGR